MRIAITDPNILIDLHYLGWLPQLTHLDLEFHTTNYVLNELSKEQVDALVILRNQRHLVVCELSDEQTTSLMRIDLPRAFSDADKSVLWYIQTQNIGISVVLSGDKPMQKWCEMHHIKAFNILWIFDQMIEKGNLSFSEANKALVSLTRFNPHLDCSERLTAWME